MLRAQQGKPYYVPPKKELLAYSDPFYCEPTDAAQELKAFLEQRIRLSPVPASEVFDELLYGVRCLCADLPMVQARLRDMGVVFAHQRDAGAFVKLYEAFHNSTRMQYNRGYTPDELFAMLPPEDRIPRSFSLGPNIRKALADGTMAPDALRRSILEADLPSEEMRMDLLKEVSDAASKGAVQKKVKIGRNDLCPCGSGKKYKKCCGR